MAHHLPIDDGLGCPKDPLCAAPPKHPRHHGGNRHSFPRFEVFDLRADRVLAEVQGFLVRWSEAYVFEREDLNLQGRRGDGLTAAAAKGKLPHVLVERPSRHGRRRRPHCRRCGSRDHKRQRCPTRTATVQMNMDVLFDQPVAIRGAA